ncbi:MAG: alpha-ketoglutarate-dependent dioxygenase AlkB [Paracoccaceae bacterium]|nr:alpha-ketoglutarate-dependent dioxygenase AlkB [Paracoccaceae bacterium]
MSCDNPSKSKTDFTLGGFEFYSALLDSDEQQGILADLRKVIAKAPMFRPMTPMGKPMSVQMSSAGTYGWYTDQQGYRYATTHPNGTPWPPIPSSILSIWDKVSGVSKQPECCLINFYGQEAKMGMHQDKDEADFRWPVVSISLGDDARFRIGQENRGGKTQTATLRSGDVVVMGGDARLKHHGVDRIDFGTSLLLPKGGRINLTLRVVD